MICNRKDYKLFRNSSNEPPVLGANQENVVVGDSA